MPTGYRATKHPDGTWTIHDVPVFASNRLRKIEVTREWQERAVAKAQRRLAEVGHIPPLHENHTGTGETVKNLGFFVPKRVGTLRTVTEDDTGALVTRDEAATYADFTRIPDAEYQRIKRGELPYVSVEAGLADHELHSAALLPCAPAIKTPPINISQEEAATAVVAYSASGGGVRATLRYAAVMDEQKPVVAPESAKPEVDPKVAPPVDAKQDEAKKPEAEGAEAPKAEAKPDAPAGLDAQQMTLLLGRVAQMETQLAALIAAAQKAQTQEIPANPENKPAPVPYAATATSASASVSAEQFGALVARLDVLESQRAAEKASAERDAKVREIVRGLQAEGFGVQPTVEGDLLKMASEKGLPAVEAYAAGWRTHGRKAPPATVEGALEAPDDPAMTEAFGALPPEARAKAESYAKHYEALNGASSLTKVQFVRSLLKADRLIKE